MTRVAFLLGILSAVYGAFAPYLAVLGVVALMTDSSPAEAASLSRFVRPQQRAIWIGDSLAGRGFPLGGSAPTTSGSFVVSQGPNAPIATITTTSPHGLIPGPGNYVQIFNVGDATYSAALNGAVVPLLSVPSPTQMTVAAKFGGSAMPNGDYSAGYLGNAWQVAEMNEMMDTSWLSWLNVFMDGYFTVVANYAQGGTGSQVGVALIPKIQSGPAADYAFIQYCTNDVNAVTPPNVTACIADINAIVSAVINLGMVPIICTPLAIGDINASPDPASIAKTNALHAIRSAELQLAASNPQVLVLDGYGASVDPQDALGRFIPSYAPVDGIHPSSFGAASIAQTISTSLKQFLPPTDTLPTSVNDDQTINSSATDIIQNGLMTGAGGNVGSSANNVVTGSPPTGWGVGGSGGTAAQPLVLAVSGNNSHTNFPGYTLDVAIQSAYANEQFQIGTNGTGGSSFGARMKVNQWYRCGFQAFSNANMTNLNLSGQVFLKFASGATPSIYFMAAVGTKWENGVPWVSGQAMTFESQPFFIPQVPTAGAYLLINGLFVGPVAGQKISIGRAFCVSVANPYAGFIPMVTVSTSSVLAGQTSTLTVTPSGGGPYSYQWYQGASGDTTARISGATGASFTTPPLNTATNYWVRVVTAGGMVEDGATITIAVTTGTADGGASDGPLPIWALGALAACLVGIASRRLRRIAP